MGLPIRLRQLDHQTIDEVMNVLRLRPLANRTKGGTLSVTTVETYSTTHSTRNDNHCPASPAHDEKPTDCLASATSAMDLRSTRTKQISDIGSSSVDNQEALRGCLSQPTCNSDLECGCRCRKETRHPRRKLAVQFDTIYIRSYNQTIGDNPSVSIGTPITLDWDYEEEAPVSINDFEATRRATRKAGSNKAVMQRLALNYYQRRSRLMYYCGHSEEEIDKAEKSVDKVRRQRNFTAFTSDLWWLEDILRSAGRKTKKMVVRERTSVPCTIILLSQA